MKIITGEYKNFWRFEWWDWWFPHDVYKPTNNGRIHLFGKLYFKIKQLWKNLLAKTLWSGTGLK